MKPQKLVIIAFLSALCFLISTQLSFAPVMDDADPEEVIRAIEIQREEAKEAQRMRKEQAQDEQELSKEKAQQAVPKASPKKRQNNQSVKFWLVTLGVVVLGLFVLSRIKSDKAK